MGQGTKQISNPTDTLARPSGRVSVLGLHITTLPRLMAHLGRFLVLLFFSQLSLAHHSEAGFDPEQRYVFEGVITDIFWGNPHILFTVDDGTTAMRIEWVTVAGADKTQVEASRFHRGERMIVIGSRNVDPAISVMTSIKELQLPEQDWQWVSPSVRRTRP